MDLFSVVVRTLFFYFFITIAYRMMGKREVGQLGIIDLIVSILIAELVAISIEKTNEPMYLVIVPISILVILEIGLAYFSLKNRNARKFFEGKPSLIISQGKIHYHEMIKQRYSLDDLLIALRQKEIKDIGDVEYAFLETNGKLSIFKYNPLKIKTSYPMPLIIDGSIERNTLKHINKDEKWLEKVLEVRNITLKEVFYAFYKNKRIFIIKKSSN